MKIHITLFVGMISILGYSQPSQDLIQSYLHETEKFNQNIESFYNRRHQAYDALEKAVNSQQLKILGSQGQYPTLIPASFSELLSFSNKGVGLVSTLLPQTKLFLTVTNIFVGYLDKGWKSHIASLEAARKKAMIDKTWEVLSWVRQNHDGFNKIMEPLRKRGSDDSEFVKEVSELFFKSNQEEAEAIWDFFATINETLIKLDQNEVTRRLFEFYIDQSSSLDYYNNPNINGALVGYLELDDKFNIKEKAIIANVAAGYAISQRLNDLMKVEKLSPMDLRVFKVLYVYSPFFNAVKNRWERNVWMISLWKNNYIPWSKYPNLNYDPDLGALNLDQPYEVVQRQAEDAHVQMFLKKHGEYDKKIDKWKVKKSIFTEFNKKLPNGTKAPKFIKELYY